MSGDWVPGIAVDFVVPMQSSRKTGLMFLILPNDGTGKEWSVTRAEKEREKEKLKGLLLTVPVGDWNN